MNKPEIIAQDHLQFEVDNNIDAFFMKKACLYGITEKEQFVKIAEDGDIYQMLKTRHELESYKGIAVHTTGWAAPLDENGETGDKSPSEHADRTRVSLVCVVTAEGMGSALAFANSSEITTDSGNATGRLSEELLECWERYGGGKV